MFPIYLSISHRPDSIESFFWFYLRCEAFPYFEIQGPRTLQLKLQKKSLSSIHTTTFSHNRKDFFNSFMYGQQFSQFFLEKSL